MCAIAFLAWAPSAVADEFGTPEPALEDCLARASLMVNRGEALVIQLFDGRRIDGNLVSFDLDNRWVYLERWDEFGASSSQVDADDIERYEYSARSGKAAGGMGAVLGAAAGAMVGASVDKDGMDYSGIVAGLFVGGSAGYAVGSALSSGGRPAGAIVCGEE